MSLIFHRTPYVPSLRCSAPRLLRCAHAKMQLKSERRLRPAQPADPITVRLQSDKAACPEPRKVRHHLQDGPAPAEKGRAGSGDSRQDARLPRYIRCRPHRRMGSLRRPERRQRAGTCAHHLKDDPQLANTCTLTIRRSCCTLCHASCRPSCHERHQPHQRGHRPSRRRLQRGAV